MTQKRKILQTLKKRIKKETTFLISDIILFGSQAKNNAISDSDYDILIIPEQKLDWIQRRRIADICADVSLEHGILIDYKIISKSEIENEPIGFHPLIIDALKHGIYA